MKILFVADHAYIPQYSGGVESNTHELILELANRGHSASVLCRFVPKGVSGIRARMSRRLSGKPYGCDTGLGYPVYRAWNVPDIVEYALKDLAPDAVIIQHRGLVRLAEKVENHKIPALIYLHSVDNVVNVGGGEYSIGDLGGAPDKLKNVQFISNSHFTAKRHKDVYGIDSVVIPPLFRAEQYRSHGTRSEVLFINPHPVKGCDIALGIVRRCPDMKFAFQEAWPLNTQMLEDIRAHISVLPNVTLRRRTRNMQRVYGNAKILLAPSICEETWARVASEAQFNGIPVVASDIGGLPESVGPGGVLLAPDSPIEAWADVTRRLWSDDAYYQQLSAAARSYSLRADLNPQRQTDTLFAAIENCLRMTRS